MSVELMIKAIKEIPAAQVEGLMIEGLKGAALHFPDPKLVKAVTSKILEALEIEVKKQDEHIVSYEYNIYLNESQKKG